jgi:hypothetical protein
MHVKPQDHATRIETLIRCTNPLPGTEPDLTPLQAKKNMFFESFPAKWRQNWIHAGKSLVTDALAELVQFMANEQLFADNNCLQTKETKSRRKKAMETRRMIAIEATKVVVVKAMVNAETEVAAVVAATVMTNFQEMD